MERISSIIDRAWPAWVWSPQDRSIVAANEEARSLWKLPPTTSLSGFLFPARAKVTKRLHGAAIALLAGAEQVQIDVKLPFAKKELWQCRRITTLDHPDGLLLLEAPQLASSGDEGSRALAEIVDQQREDHLWSEDALNALAVPVIMLAGDGKILNLNEEAQRLAPSDLMTEAVGDLWTRPSQFRDFFTRDEDINRALDAIAEAHRTGSASFIASLKGVPGYPGELSQVLLQAVSGNHARSPLMVTLHKLADGKSLERPEASSGQRGRFKDLYDELEREGIVAFVLTDEGRIAFFTSHFAEWMGRPRQDIGSQTPTALGLTPAPGDPTRHRRAADWRGRHVIRRSDGTVDTITLTPLRLPAPQGESAPLLCIGKIESKEEKVPAHPFAVLSQSGVRAEEPPRTDSSPLRTDPQNPFVIPPQSEDEDFATDDWAELAFEEGQETDDNLVRLDDWRNNDKTVLTGGSFQALIDDLNVPLLGLDNKGRILFVNDPLTGLLDKSVSDLRGTLLSDLFRAPENKRLQSFIRLPRATHERDLTKGLKMRLREGAAMGDDVIVRLHPLREKSPIRFCAFLKPTQTLGLEGPIGNASEQSPPPASLGEPRKGQTDETKKRADFVARVSHEIRTPLNAILGFSDMILSESLGPIGNEKYKEYMKDIKESGSLILSLVNDILDLAKAEAQSINIELKGMNIETSMRRVASMLSGEAESHGVRLSINVSHPLPAILADERSVMQILLNLVSNAIKFSSDGGEVLIRARPQGKDHVCLAVTDQGIGMNEEDLKKALSPYEQAETNTLTDARGKPIGTGLGLPISKALAEANRAEFRIHSAQGKGTTVEILFNRARQAAE